MLLLLVAVPAQEHLLLQLPKHVGTAGLGEDLSLLPGLHQTHEVIAALLIPLCRGCRRRGAGPGGAVLAACTPPGVTQNRLQTPGCL